MTAHGADESVGIECAEQKVDIGAGVDTEALRPHLHRVDFFGRAPEGVGMLAQRADSLRAKRRGIRWAEHSHQHDGRYCRLRA
jgi:hypothetical protein